MIRVVLFAIFCLSFSENVLGKPKHCPSVPPQFPFKMNKFQGKWNIVEMMAPQPNAPPLSCAEMSVVQTSPRTFHQELEAKLPNGAPYKAGDLMTAIDPFLGSHGNWSVHGVNFEFSVPLTDYDNYAVVHACRETPEGGLEMAAVMSRHETMHPGKLLHLKTQLALCGVDVSKMYPVENKACATSSRFRTILL